jgi:hypothetical protein
MKYSFGALGLVLIYGFLAYAVSTYLYIGLAVGALFGLILIVFVVPLVLRYEEKERKRHECYRFINTFVISLSVSQSGESALEAASLDMKGEEKSIYDALGPLSIEEKIGYFANYFPGTSYAMFLSIFRLFESQGGEVLELAEPLLKEITLEEGKGDALSKIRRKNLVSFASLWGMSCLVLAFTRFGLANFYSLLARSIPYLVTQLAYFALALLSFVLFAVSYTGEKISFQRRKKDGAVPIQKTR